MFYLVCADYFTKTWLKESALWTIATIELLQDILKKHTFGNNQHSEGIVNNEKGKPDIRLTCQEPASYILERYEDYRKYAQTLVNDLDMDHQNMVIRKNKSADK